MLLGTPQDLGSKDQAVREILAHTKIYAFPPLKLLRIGTSSVREPQQNSEIEKFLIV